MHTPSITAMRLFRAASPVLLVLTLGCTTGRIPNTEVADTSENRALVSFCERYRRAVETRDARSLLAMASPDYYEDAGTPRGDDDYGYDGLQRMLTAWADEVGEVRYEIRYRRVTVDPERPNRIAIDYTFTGSYTLRRPAGNEVAPRGGGLSFNVDPVRDSATREGQDDIWFRRVGDNRLELERVGDDFRIVSGM